MPLILRVPASMLMPWAGSTIGSGMQTSTPPIASTMPWKPSKSTTTKWSSRIPVSCSNCWTVQAGPPRPNASFHITLSAPGMVEPSVALQSGRSTIESRGIEMP